MQWDETTMATTPTTADKKKHINWIERNLNICGYSIFILKCKRGIKFFNSNLQFNIDLSVDLWYNIILSIFYPCRLFFFAIALVVAVVCCCFCCCFCCTWTHAHARTHNNPFRGCGRLFGWSSHCNHIFSGWNNTAFRALWIAYFKLER